jgi:hypothetical protein
MLFRIKPDSSLTARWALGSPTIAGNELDPRRFTSGEVYEGPIAGLRVPVTVDGARTACTFGAFDMPIVNAGVHGSMVGVGGIQWVPIQVGDSRDELFIMNALSVVDCIDTERTIGHKWMAASGRPEKVGQYRGIVKLALDEGRLAYCLDRGSSCRRETAGCPAQRARVRVGVVGSKDLSNPSLCG